MLWLLIAWALAAPPPEIPGMLIKPRSVTLEPTDLPVAGPDDAEVVVVEVVDWRCPHCAKAWPVLLDAVRQAPSTRLVLRNFPLSPPCNPTLRGTDAIGQRCELAAGSICASQQGRLLAYAQDVFADLDADVLAQRPWSKRRFSRCLAQDDAQRVVMEQARAAQDAGVSGTPTVFVRIEGTWYEAAPWPEVPRLLQALTD